MNELELARELSRRTSLSEDTTATVLRAIHALVQEGVVDLAAFLATPPPPDVPPDDPGLVEDLITRAKKHPLGIEFLASGLLATVAITLGAHAFTVEAARRRLAKEENGETDKEHERKTEENEEK